MAQVYQAMMSGDTANAVALIQQTQQLRQKLGLPPLFDAPGLGMLAEIQTTQGNFAEARKNIDAAKSLAQQDASKDDDFMFGFRTGVLSALRLADGGLAESTGDIPAAGQAFRDSLDLLQKLGMADSVEATGAMIGLGDVDVYQGNLQDAAARYSKVLTLQEQTFGPQSVLLLRVLNDLAIVDMMQSQLAQAERLLNRTLTIGKNNAPITQLAVGYGALAAVYYAEGKFREAEDAISSAIATSQSLPGGDANLPMYKALLGAIYDVQGRSQEAQQSLEEALTQQKQLTGGGGVYEAEISELLAGTYINSTDNTKSDQLFTDAKAILTKELGSNSPLVVGASEMLAMSLIQQGKYPEAEQMLQQAAQIEKSTGGSSNALDAVALRGLGWSQTSQGQFAPAEASYQKALSSQIVHLGTVNPLVGDTELELASLYYAWGRPDKAALYFAEDEGILYHQFLYGFTYMSERDRLAYLESEHAFLGRYLSFCLSRYRSDPSVAGHVYDLLLWEKGMVAESMVWQQARLRSGGDTAALKLLDEIAAKRNRYAALASAQPAAADAVAGWKQSLEQLQQQINGLEEQVARSSALPQSPPVSWQQVQKSLKPGEAAVEIVKFRFYDGKQWTDRQNYAALVLKSDSKQPAWIDLGAADKLEESLEAAYFQRIAAPPETKELTLLDAACVVGQHKQPAATAPAPDVSGDPLAFYNLFWKPVSAALGHTTRIYIATDGALNQVALGLIPAPDGSLLQDLVDLRVLNRTAELIGPIASESAEAKPGSAGFPKPSAVIFANPTFLISEDSYRQKLKDLNLSAAPEGAEPVPTIAHGNLALGTCAELPQVHSLQVGLQNDVEPLLKDHGFTVNAYVQDEALVEALQNVQGPRVLHIATHGDFVADPAHPGGMADQVSPSLLSDPMLRSRLYFAAAQHSVDGKAWPSDLSDGILTAYQASMLNLRGTELVVLSACDTGRGKVQNGEGVFGLRRAFQEAGAESVLMSLWEVPSTETQELLTKFYRHWLVDGMDKHQALLQAQRDEREAVRKKYGRDLPYFWGAFILVGR
jgi:tetratricopeptide (TPR) repeat protein